LQRRRQLVFEQLLRVGQADEGARVWLGEGLVQDADDGVRVLREVGVRV
jgi:hypothetical protein